MRVHLIDGTYELFRHYFALPAETNSQGMEIAAARGVVVSMLNLLADGATHVAVATDHVIESFRNDMWPGYKTGAGIEPDLRSQFPLLEDALVALGMEVWPMVEQEADDGMASGAALAEADPRVEQVLLCTPDKDLAQCVVGDRVIQYDRRRNLRFNDAGVREKFGVDPASIPDYLALVGDSADGFPGLRGWGAKSSATLLSRYGHVEDIPTLAKDWDVSVRSAPKLATTLAENLDLALLFRELATLVRDAPVAQTVDELYWSGPTDDLGRVCELLNARDIQARAVALAEGR